MLHRYGRLLAGGALLCASSALADPVTVVQSLQQGSQLVTVDSAAPTVITSTIPVTGLGVGERLIGFDSYPGASRILYGISTSGQVYSLNGFTGAATAIGAPIALSGFPASTAFKFNPTTGDLRLVTDATQNLRVSPQSSAVLSTDTPVAYAPGDAGAGKTPNVTGGAFTNKVLGAKSTAFYVIETNRGVLAVQGAAAGGPAGGQLTTVGALGVGAGANSSIDISRTGQSVALINDPLVRMSALYSINLATGAATLIGQLAAGTYTGLAFTAAPLQSFGLTANQTAVGAAFDNFTGAPSAGLISAIGAFDGLSAADTANALQQLSPAAYSLLPELVFQSMESQDTTIRKYLRDVRQGGTDDSAQGDPDGRAQIGSNRKLGMWFTGNARYGFFKGAVDRYRTSYGAIGGTGGIDFRLRPNILVGLTGGYDEGRAHLNPFSPDSKIDTWYAGAYGTVGFGPFYVEGHGSYGRSNFALRRLVSIGSYQQLTGADPKSENVSGAGTVGASFRASGIELEPYVGALYNHVAIDGFSELGSPTGLTLGRVKRESIQSIAGLRLGGNITVGDATVRPSIRGEYHHEFEDRRARTLLANFADAGISTPFLFTTTPLKQDFAEIGAGFTVSGHSPFSVMIDYEGQIGKDRSINGITGGFRLAF